MLASVTQSDKSVFLRCSNVVKSDSQRNSRFPSIKRYIYAPQGLWWLSGTVALVLNTCQGVSSWNDHEHGIKNETKSCSPQQKHWRLGMLFGASSGLPDSGETIPAHLNASTRIMAELSLGHESSHSLCPSAAVWPYCSLLCSPNGPHMGWAHHVVSMSQPFSCVFSACVPHTWHFLYCLLSAGLMVILYSPIPADHKATMKPFTSNCL